MKPTLVILSGENTGKKISLEPGRRYILGRDEQADIPLAEKKISRRHATLYWNPEDSQILIEDLNSLNGTFVNQEVIAQVTALNDQDRIQIGSFLMEIKIPEDSLVVELEPSKRSKDRSTDFSKNSRDSDDSVELTGGKLISGKLQELSLPDLLQMLATTKKTGRLVVSKRKITDIPTPSVTLGGDIGSLYLQNGELLHVDFNGLINEEAFFALLPWNKGHFALFPHRDFNFSRMIEMPIEGLLLEGFRRLDEQNASRIDISNADVFTVNLDEPLTHLNPNELAVFQTAWKHKTAAKIFQNTGLDKKEATEILQHLMRRGFIKREA